MVDIGLILRGRIFFIGSGVILFVFCFGSEILLGDVSRDLRGEGIINQGDFAKLLVKKLEIERRGIPRDGEVEDYFSLLRGGESVNVEAESFEGEGEGLVKSTFPEGGYWISSERGMSRIDYRVDLPFSGIYWLRVKGKGSTQFWTVDEERTEILTPTSSFQWLDLGRYILSRGSHRVTVALPNNSGLDLFLFSADNLRDATPASGWDASRPLTFGIMAEVMVKLMNYEKRLPVDETYIFKYKILEKRFSTDINFAVGKFYLIVEDSGVYTISTDVRGEKPIIFYIKGGRRVINPSLKEKAEKVELYASLPGKDNILSLPRLSQERVNLQEIVTAYFKKGEYIIETLIAPNSSVERFERLKRRSTSQDYLDILRGIGIRVGGADEPVNWRDAEDALANEEFIRAATIELTAPPLFEFVGPFTPLRERGVPLEERVEEGVIGPEEGGLAGPTVLSPIGEERRE